MLSFLFAFFCLLSTSASDVAAFGYPSGMSTAARSADGPESVGADCNRIAGAAGSLSDVVWSAVLSDGTVFALHDDLRWTLSEFVAERCAVVTATAVVDARAPQGPVTSSSVPCLSITYVDASGQKVRCDVPVTSAADGEIERVVKLLKRLNEEMRKQIPPAPVQPSGA